MLVTWLVLSFGISVAASAGAVVWDVLVGRMEKNERIRRFIRGALLLDATESLANALDHGASRAAALSLNLEPALARLQWTVVVLSVLLLVVGVLVEPVRRYLFGVLGVAGVVVGVVVAGWFILQWLLSRLRIK
jgi:hypothetical protein